VRIGKVPLKPVIAALIISLIISLIETWSDLFSTETMTVKLLILLGTMALILLFVGPGVYVFHQQAQRNAELNRAVDERIKRQEEAEERRRIYEGTINAKAGP
jgi:type III secretory pathway component EscS